MQKSLYFIIACFISSFSIGQQYKTIDILKKADSFLKIKVGEDIFKTYFSYDTHSYYEYKTRKGKTKWETLTDYKQTKGHFKSISVRYNFCLKIFNAPCSMAIIDLDSLLNNTNIPAIDYIPEYIQKNSKCNFINDSIAVEIAKPIFTKRGIKELSGSFSYDHDKKLYIWTISNYLTENTTESGEKHGEIQWVVIDAILGKVIDFIPTGIYSGLH